ncbi:MAG TPA: DUF2851 family protein [Dongiaceae bacterium]|nr:DUF2851 family protein [Dongiaceae bacterium]
MLPPNFYSDWRQRIHAANALREDAPEPPPERLLASVWREQRLLREQLVTATGEPVRVLHPGFHNHEAGPDFRGAVIQFGAGAPQTGDVEIDVHASGWRAHGHDCNPNFQSVILHVIWAGKADSYLPTLLLQSVLERPLRELEPGPEGVLPEDQRGKCAGPLGELAGELQAELLHQAAQVRLQTKATALEARARQTGWEQALWEGLFRALGYKQNVWPMLRLAELRPLWREAAAPDPLVLQARLLGLAGLLPAEMNRDNGGGDNYLRAVWQVWWRERDRFQEHILPKPVWKFSGLRPANHPQRRLALAAHWLATESLPTRLEDWVAAPLPAAPEALADSLENILRTPPDDYWSWHWTLRSARLAQPKPLLGRARVTDLAVNVILPWLWARAAAGFNDKLRRELEQAYHRWPAGEDNSRLRLARQRLWGGPAAPKLNTSARQQGLLQITRDFCDHVPATCAGCRFPELVQAAQSYNQPAIPPRQPQSRPGTSPQIWATGP